jgi:phenylglyoxylate dehydrogenase epsilon subunit
MGKYVIIGDSSAGISALQAIRKIDLEGSITIISKEHHPPYTPIVLPYVIEGKIGEEGIGLREEDFFRKNYVKLIKGKEVTGVQPTKKILTFRDGGTIGFEKLLIATGSQPIIPAIPGVDFDEVCSLRILGDAIKIKKLSQERETVAVIGAGMIGIRLAEILAKKGLQVTVIEKMPQILSQNFDAFSASMIKKIFEENGVKIYAGVSFKGIEMRGARLKVQLNNGNEVSVDFIVLSVGVKPSMELLKGSGIKCRHGILVDNRMQTNFHDIYAAGDVAEAKNFFADEKILNPIQSDAVEQGFVAGSNMAGGAGKYSGGINMNVLKFFSNNAFSVGLYNKGEPITHFSLEKNLYRKLVIEEDRLVGAVFFNDEVDPGVIYNLIKEKTRLAGMKQEIISRGVNFESWLRCFLEDGMNKELYKL